MINSITIILEAFVNPLTKKTFKQENRIVNISKKSDEITIIYKRDGFTHEFKRKIEDLMIKSLEKFCTPEQICLKSVSVKPLEQVDPKIDMKRKSLPQKKRISNVKKILAISSAKGGVGKSTVAVNLAVAIQRLNRSVGLIDADIYGPSIPTMMGRRDAKPQANKNKQILPIRAHGIRFMSFGLFVDESEAVIWRGPMLGGILKQFLFDVDWGELDYLIIDLPPGTGDMQLSLEQFTEVDAAIVVSTPQTVALLDSTKGLAMFQKLRVPVLGMIENMSFFSPDGRDEKYYIFGRGGVQKICDKLEVNYLGEIPLEIELREASDRGVPYMACEEYEDRDVWKSYLELTTRIDRKLFLDNSRK